MSGPADLGVLADLVVGALPCAVVVADPDGRIIHINQAAAELVGWSVAELTSGGLPHVPPGLMAERTAMLERAGAGEVVAAVTQRLHKDGRLVDLRADLAPVHDAAGRHAATVIMLRDLTQELADAYEVAERQRLMERLSHAVREINADLDLQGTLDRICQRAKDLVDASSAGFALIDGAVLKIVAYVNAPPGALDRTWPVSEGLTGKAIATRQPVVVGDIHAAGIWTAANRKVISEIRTIVCVPTIHRGTVIGALYVNFPDANHPVSRAELDVLSLLSAHAAGAYANAVEHAAVTQAQQRQRAVVDATADGMALVGADGLVVDWNSAAESLTGVPEHEAVGAPPPFPIGEVGGVLDHRLPSGRWLEIVTSRVGATAETVLDFRDVTQTKRLEEARELFLATTSHELRTPITVVKGFAGTLLHRWDDLTDAERRAAVSTIVQRTESLAALVDQLLLGSSGAAAFDVEIAPFDLLAAVRESLAGVEALSIEHSIVLEAADDLPLVLGDRATIDVIVGQLLENAIKYSPDGGDIRLSVRPDGGFVTVRVSDEGIGLDPDDAELVFERFYQAPGGNRRRLGGVGLGLYIVRRLIEAQRGAVRAYGTPGVGTTVEFALPAADRAAAPVAGEAAAAAEG